MLSNDSRKPAAAVSGPNLWLGRLRPLPPLPVLVITECVLDRRGGGEMLVI